MTSTARRSQKDRISRITDNVVGEMAEWVNRPLDTERRLLDQAIFHAIYLEDEQIPGTAALASAMPDRLSTLE